MDQAEPCEVSVVKLNYDGSYIKEWLSDDGIIYRSEKGSRYFFSNRKLIKIAIGTLSVVTFPTLNFLELSLSSISPCETEIYIIWTLKSEFNVEGFNLYRRIFRTSVLENTVVFSRGGPTALRRGQLLQIRNSGHNRIERNLLVSASRRGQMMVGYRETEQEPPNELNTFSGNIWCLRTGALLSWNLPGGGMRTDRRPASFPELSGDRTGRILSSGFSRVCRDVLGAASDPNPREAFLIQDVRLENGSRVGARQ